MKPPINSPKAFDIATIKQPAKRWLKATVEWLAQQYFLPLVGVGLVAWILAALHSFGSELKNILHTPPIQWQTIDVLILVTLFATLLTSVTLSIRWFSKRKHPEHLKQLSTEEEQSQDLLSLGLYQKITTIYDKSVFLDKPNQYDLRSDVDKHPPFQQDALIKSYIGLRVHWLLTLHYVLPNEGSPIIDVGFHTRIRGVTDTNDHPEIKIAPMNTPFEVWGEITDIRYPSILLGIHHLELYKEPRTATVGATKGLNIKPDAVQTSVLAPDNASLISQQQIRHLNNLSGGDKRMLKGYFDHDSKSQMFHITDPGPASLAARYILYRPGSGGYGLEVPFCISEWAWEYLKEHPELLR